MTMSDKKFTLQVLQVDLSTHAGTLVHSAGHGNQSVYLMHYVLMVPD